MRDPAEFMRRRSDLNSCFSRSMPGQASHIEAGSRPHFCSLGAHSWSITAVIDSGRVGYMALTPWYYQSAAVAESFFIPKQCLMCIVPEILQDIWHTNNA